MREGSAIEGVAGGGGHVCCLRCETGCTVVEDVACVKELLRLVTSFSLSGSIFVWFCALKLITYS